MSDSHAATVPHRVVIAGGGVAGLEALIALHQLAGDRVATTLVAPTDEFTIRALSVQDPFARPASGTYDLKRICADNGATFVHDALHEVQREGRVATTVGGSQLPYDSLIVAIGARPSPAFHDAITFRGLQDAEAMHGLLQDIEGGYSTRIAFIVPPGTTWPLPLYELALMTAERADGLGLGVALTLVTPEPEPLALFGREASSQVDDLLAERGIIIRTNVEVTSVDKGVVTSGHGQVEARAQRVVALPVLNGPRIPGLPADDAGFLRVDDRGRVAEADGIYGAGDGTTQPIKQGGIAAQVANAVARDVAARAGADISTDGFSYPVLRAELFTGAQSKFLRGLVGSSDEQASRASDHALWWPPTKVAAPHLTPYLASLDAGTPPPGRPKTRTVHAEGDPSGGIEVLG
jgi:sulfide:quinone oxidoreductase